MPVLSIAAGLNPLYSMAIVAFYSLSKEGLTGLTKIGDTPRVELKVADGQVQRQRRPGWPLPVGSGPSETNGERMYLSLCQIDDC